MTVGGLYCYLKPHSQHSSTGRYNRGFHAQLLQQQRLTNQVCLYTLMQV